MANSVMEVPIKFDIACDPPTNGGGRVDKSRIRAKAPIECPRAERVSRISSIEIGRRTRL